MLLLSNGLRHVHTVCALLDSVVGSLHWRHNGRDCVSNHQPHDCLLNRLFRRRSKNTSKLGVTGFCAGNSPVTGEFPAQRPVTRSFDVFFDCAWINGWVNNREAGDLRRHRAHYDVTVMSWDMTYVLSKMLDRKSYRNMLPSNHWKHVFILLFLGLDFNPSLDK